MGINSKWSTSGEEEDSFLQRKGFFKLELVSAPLTKGVLIGEFTKAVFVKNTCICRIF